MRNKIRAALRYYKSHLWIEIAVSIVLISVVLLLIFYFYLRNQYYEYLISETEKTASVIILVLCHPKV